MRQGEILALRWEHIDLRHGVAHLPETKNGHSRDVPLSRRARNFLQMMPVNLHGNVFDYTASGFKNAWRIATQRLRIEDLHFHDLRHEAISRFFELGCLNVMEIAAISGHRSMNMLKRYTHLRAWQLVSKLDARRRQTQKVAAWFVPYPAHITIRCNGTTSVHFLITVPAPGTKPGGIFIFILNNMMKPRSSYSKTAFILLFSVFLVAAVTKAKSSLPDITLEQAKEMNADNTVIFLFRHGERCDRSDMPCYSDKSGITITGTEKAQQEGIKFATIFSEYDIYSSNAVRTIQTAKFFSGKEPVVMDSLSDCNNDLYKTLESIARESHKRNIVIMTHNHCLSFLARDRLGKKFKPAYLDALIMHYDGTRLILDGKYNKEA